MFIHSGVQHKLRKLVRMKTDFQRHNCEQITTKSVKSTNSFRSHETLIHCCRGVVCSNCVKKMHFSNSSLSLHISFGARKPNLPKKRHE